MTDAAGVRGVLFTAVRADSGTGSAKVAMDLDYSGFANAYGGDYGRRLRLVRLPACVLTTPSRPECQVQAPLSGSVNNMQARVVSADSLDVSGVGGALFPAVGAGRDTVPVGSPSRPSPGKKNQSGSTVNTPSVSPETSGQAVYALAAAASSDAGDYTHTSLSPTYSWGAGTQGGDFSYSIPLAVPPTAAGPMPNLALQYSSGSVDGKTTSTNNQPSWIGEGWDLQIGYIERSFKTCGDDETSSAHANDLCWVTDNGTLMDNNATMVFQGKSTRLVKDDSGDHWHGESDDGSRIEMITGESWTSNGDHDSAYWRVTTTDGTQYYFGRNKRWAGDPDTTDSTQNVLVYGNHSGEPCYHQNSSSNPRNWGCTWTYRWNLDYVVDPNLNSMTYYYQAYVNKYGNYNATSNYVYDATAIIKRIDYGTRADAEGEGPAPQQVIFGEGPRCSDFTGACVSYPDTPWDLACAPNGTYQCSQTSPTYWNPWRLVALQTQVFDPVIGAYQPVDSWSLTPEYPATGSGEAPSLWMTHLDHNGYTGGTTMVAPQMDFDGALLANRVNGSSALNHYRLWRIKNLAGGVTEVTYEPTECTTGLLATITKNQNPYRCFPDSNGTTWFHKYVVSHVTEHDLTGGGPDEVWDYQYSTAGSNTNALWHFDNNEQAPVSRRTWNDFAGYSMVTVLHGPIGGAQSRTRKLFHRGMDGDYMGSGVGNRYAFIQDSTGENALDQYPLRGFLREEQTLNGNGDVVSKAVHLPTLNLNPATVNGGTAHRAASWPGGTFDAFLLREYKTLAATWVAATNSWRTTSVERTFDDVYGLVESTFNDGDPDTTSDDTCTTTSYAQNATLGLVNYPSQTLTTDCTASASGSHILSGTQTLYDGTTTIGAQPTHGLVTKTNQLAAMSGTTLTWSVATWAEHDALGRVVGSYDALGHKTTTIYTPPAGGPVTRATTINPLGHGSTTTYDPGRRLATSVVDANGKRTSLEYDGLGRLLNVYKPHGTGGAATDYSVTAGSAPYVAGDTAVSLTGDDVHTQISLPFSFPYWGNSYSSAWLSSNGLLSFTDHVADGGSFPLPDTDAPNNAIYAFWDDLNLTSSSTVKTKTVGATPNRQFIIDYHNVGFWDKPGAVSFSITLSETTGVIAFNYTDIDQASGLERGDNATIGIENADGTAATVYLDDQPILADNTTVTFTPITARATTLPDIAYDYKLSNNGPNVVSTKQLTPAGTQLENLELYDGRFRLRQTQTPADEAHGGRVINDTIYNDHGLTAQTSTLYNSGPLDRSFIVTFPPTTAVIQHRFTYDDLDRPTVDALYINTTQKWQTVTGYDGDRTWTIPPSGGTPTMTLTDSAGNTVALRQYTSGTPPTSSSYQTTTYNYDRRNRLTELTDPDGVQWSNTYDLRSRVVSSTDPDKGTSNRTYDETGRLIKTVDARNATLSYGYDALGRRSGVFDGPTTSGFKRAGWVYDTIAKGQLTSSTRYLPNGDSYTSAVTGYNDQYQPLGASVSLPTALGPLAGTYTIETTYNINGFTDTTTLPAAGSLLAETVTTGYDTTGRVRSLTGNGVYADDDYVADTSYYNFGPVYQQILGSGTKRVELTTDIDQATGRLTNSKVRTTNQTTTTAWDEQLNQAYSYDDAGNVKSIYETTAGTIATNQCFTYDGLRQLKEAWTIITATCQATPTQADVDGADPYWSTYTYTTTGSRTTEKRHASTGDTTYTYTYPTSGQRHTLTSVSATGTDNYTYDAIGNTVTRNLAGKPGQTLTWDNEGHLASVADSSGTTTYVYDADGNRLIGTDPTGTTAYLGAYQLKLVGSAVTGTRFYGGASRTPAGVAWIASDPHGTGELAIDATTLTAIRRKTDAFGNPRGTDLTWPNTKGFVGGTRDLATGLTHLGAREYDPAIGRFVSADPIVDTTDPQQVHGYAYAANNPAAASDPSGTKHDWDEKWQGTDGMSGHDATAAVTAVIATIVLNAQGIKGYTTFDRPVGSELHNPENLIKGSNQSGDGTNGYADVIFWGENVVYVWEVKPGNEYGRANGPVDLDRYIRCLQEQLRLAGDPRIVEPGPGLPAIEPVPSNQGDMRNWSERGDPGVRYYGPSKKQPATAPSSTPTPAPPAAAANSNPTQNPTQGTNAHPEPNPRAGVFVQGPGCWESTACAATVVGVGLLLAIGLALLLSPIGA